MFLWASHSPTRPFRGILLSLPSLGNSKDVKSDIQDPPHCPGDWPKPLLVWMGEAKVPQWVGGTAGPDLLSPAPRPLGHPWGSHAHCLLRQCSQPRRTEGLHFLHKECQGHSGHQASSPPLSFFLEFCAHILCHHLRPRVQTIPCEVTTPAGPALLVKKTKQCQFIMHTHSHHLHMC